MSLSTPSGFEAPVSASGTYWIPKFSNWFHFSLMRNGLVWANIYSSVSRVPLTFFDAPSYQAACCASRAGSARPAHILHPSAIRAGLLRRPGRRRASGRAENFGGLRTRQHLQRFEGGIL